MKKPLSLTDIKFIAFFLAAACCLYGCGKEKPGKDFVAKVDGSYLSYKDISKDLDTSGLQLSHRNEYIRNWIETELFFSEAVSEGILKDKDFLHLLEKSKKELARTFLIQKILEKNPIQFKTEELEDFFNSHKDEFLLSHDAYSFNKIVFNDESKAILFRSALMESDWNGATNVFGKDKAILSERSYIFESDYEVLPKSLLMIIQELQPNEVSIILNTEPNQFVVVQLIRKYLQNEIPEYEAVKPLVLERFLMRKREQLLHDYLKNLYSKHKIELKSGK